MMHVSNSYNKLNWNYAASILPEVMDLMPSMS